MKEIILIFCLLFFFDIGFCQTINDLLVRKINYYRKENDLPELKISLRAKIANDQQLNYMVQTSTVPMDHSQKLKSKYPLTFQTFDERIDYVYKDGYHFVGENLIGMVYEKNNEETAQEIFENWENSPSHNELMLSPEPSGLYVNYKITDKIIVDGVVYDKHKIIYCVLTIYN